MDAQDGRLSRRNMVLGLTGSAAMLGVASVAAAPLGIVPAPAGGKPSLWDREYWTLEGAGQAEWAKQIGGIFSVQAENGVKTMRLASVKALASGGERPRDVGRASAFEAMFDAPGAVALKDGRTYQVTHTKYGAMQVFLAPGAKAGRLLAVFN